MDAEAVDWLARRGYEPEYGARPLRAHHPAEVDTPLSRLLLDGALTAWGEVRVEVKDDELAFRIDEKLVRSRGGAAGPS